MIRRAAIALALALAWPLPAAGESLSLDDIVGMGAAQRGSPERPGRAIREEAVRGAAFRLAAQNAWAAEMSRLEDILRGRSDEIDRIYDFRLLMRAFPQTDKGAYLLPPAIAHMDQRTDAQEDGSRIVKESGVYEITDPARLVPQPPDWREWLILSERVSAAEPHPALLPKERSERRAWAEAAEAGWEAGKAQARREMVSRMSGLHRAYAGRIRYLRLLLEGRISPPEVEGEVTHARIDGTVLAEVTELHRIRSRSAFADPDQWRMFAIDPLEAPPGVGREQ